MQRRIFGLETEYGVMFRAETARGLRPSEPIRELFLSSPGEQKVETGFLGNGARFYLDVGEHPEYATPECDSAYDLVAHDKAGERRLDHLTRKAEERLQARDIPGQLYAFKNNTDSTGSTYGCHENYLVRREVDLYALLRFLSPFFATRQLLVGAGKLRMIDGRPAYSFSQRAGHIDVPLSAGTTSKRGMVNERDEAHADKAVYRRLHVIVGDANMSETTTLLKVVSTHLVLGLFESGIRLKHLTLRDPVQAIRTVGLDVTGKAPLDLESGSTITAIDLQRGYLYAAARYAERSGLTAEPAVKQALELWGRTLDALSEGDRGRIDREIDWAIKLSLFDRYSARHGAGLDDPRLAQLDLRYHDIRPDRGLFGLMTRRGEVERAVTDEAIEAAATVPPATTRAHVRGGFLRDLATYGPLRGGPPSINWSSVSTQGAGGSPIHVYFHDPFATQNDELDVLRARMRERAGQASVTAPAQTPAPPSLGVPHRRVPSSRPGIRAPQL